MKVATCINGTCFILPSAILAAWDWIISQKANDDRLLIINTSIGSSKWNYTSASACDCAWPSFATAANTAVANGIALFGSSGNAGYSDKISFPACLSKAISVGGVFDADMIYNGVSYYKDHVTPDSNSADFLGVLAPSYVARTTTLNNQYQDFGGTSAASPYAAGAAAVLQDYAKKTYGRYFTYEEVKARLLVNGDPITDSKNGITKPRVNIARMIDPTTNQYSIKIGGTSYNTLQSAYNAATNGATIKVKANYLTESLNVNRNISVNLEGGFNYNYTYICGVTTLKGKIQTYSGGGTLNIKNFKLTQ